MGLWRTIKKWMTIDADSVLHENKCTRFPLTIADSQKYLNKEWSFSAFYKLKFRRCSFQKFQSQCIVVEEERRFDIKTVYQPKEADRELIFYITHYEPHPLRTGIHVDIGSGDFGFYFPEERPPSPHPPVPGRCGPHVNDQICTSEAIYCNEANGWCGNTDAHKNAQLSTAYDFQVPGRCGPHVYDQICTSEAIHCNEANGWCGNTDAHKNAQLSTAYDFQAMTNLAFKSPKGRTFDRTTYHKYEVMKLKKKMDYFAGGWTTTLPQQQLF